MTLKISRSAKTGAAPIAGQAGTKMVAIFEYTFTQAFTAATDILELGFIPAHAQVLNAKLVSTAFGALTADVGILDGEQGSNDDTRSLTGTEFFNDASINNTEVAGTTKAGLAIAKSEKHRGIGVEVSANVAAGSNKLTLVLEYVY